MPDLHDDIQAVFAHNQYPGDDRLTVYNVDALEHDETRQLLLGCRWQDMPVVEFLSGDTPIPDLTPEAFHYYMPALLLAAVDPNSDDRGDVAHSVVFSLTPSNAFETGEFGYDDRDGFQQRMSLFTGPQREAMARALLACAEMNGAEMESIQEAVGFLRG